MLRSVLRVIPVVLVLVAVAGIASAATIPPTSTISVPSSVGQTASVSWQGDITLGVNPTSDCANLAGTAAADEHDSTVSVPAGAYSSFDAQFTFNINWTDATGANDEILTVLDPDGNEVGSSDGGTPSETVSGTNLKAGTYRILACGFTSGPQHYNGLLTIRTVPREANLPSAPAQGLQFSAAVAADNQRDEAEPLVHVDLDGNIYTCGPTGFSNLSDYAQVSTDHGNQFHLLGTPPRGQQSGGGGGDCAVSTGIVTNSNNAYQYAYTGLGALTGFASSTSPDNGHNLTTGGPFATHATTEGGGADRQWMVFVDDKTVRLSYNQQEPRNVVIQKSTDGGLTYSPVAVVAAPAAQFPGPMAYDAAHHLVFFAWDKKDANGTNININLSVSHDEGATWTTCRAAVAPVDTAGFIKSDYDSQGNIYLAYTEAQRYHTYLTVLKHADVGKCDTPTSVDQPTNNPGFIAPVQVDRDNVRSTVFPWLTAGPEPGRVAVAFYGTESDGDPNTGTFDASWDVYVNQSLNAFDASPTFSQVKATTHPFHFDSICLNGLGCDIAAPPGDRSLADFFAIDYDPATHALVVVFNRTNKKPDEAAGHVGSPMVVVQRAGPSNGGGLLPGTAPAIVRTSSTDPEGDALSSDSALAPGSANPTNEAAGDFKSVSVGPEIDLIDGTPIKNGGFTVTMKIADLSDAALQSAISATHTKSLSLLWLWRFTNGYQDVAAAARWNPVQGFTFGYNDFTTGTTPCASTGPLPSQSEKCIVYPGGQPIQGDVNQVTGTIRLSVPRFLLRALSGPSGNGQRPAEVAAQPGSRFYDGTAFSLANPISPLQDVQTFLYPLDNTPAMDFLLPTAGGGGGGGGGGGATECKVNGGGSIVAGSQGNFTVNAHANLKGNIQYRDDANSIDFKATSITSVTCNDVQHSARIKGMGTNRNDVTPKAYQVDVVDNGESGTNDVFGIQITSTTGSNYGKSGRLTRGNVQIH